jgi:exopolysaccharide biosynthesis polyprenyl glycosylphosphotransferase
MLFSPSPRRKRLQLRISERRLLLMIGDALAVVASVFISLFIWSVVADEPFNMAFIAPQTYWFFLLVALWLILAGANDFYELPIAANRALSMQRLIVITLQMLVVYLLVFFFSPRGELPRLFIFYYGVSSFVLIALWRLLNPALIGWASTPRRILVVGADESTQALIDIIQENGTSAFQVRGIIGQTKDVGQTVSGIPVIGTGSDLLNFVIRDRISELVITDIPDLTSELFQGVMDSYERGVVLTPMPILYERLTGRIPVKHVRNDWAVVFPLAGTSIFNPYPFLQRFMDITLSIIGLVIFVLMLPVLALIIRLDSPGSTFYSQIRTGRNGRNFKIIKFRTMVADAEAATGAVFSHQGDPRVTRVGRFMRKTRLDEIPQLFNVIKGEMSIVGPRPERPEHIDRLTEKIPFYRTRLVIRPGVTGWAQVQYDYGADDVDAEVKLEYDLYYIRHQSLLLDIQIIIRTAGKMFKMSGV